MFSSIKRSAIAFIVLLSGCVKDQRPAQTTGFYRFYNIDSLVTAQISALEKLELTKSVSIDGREEQTRFIPDSLQWANELDIFRQLDQVNKASVRDAYVVTDIRDTNSNLMVREIKSQREVPVSMLKLYYLRTPGDIRKIEATFREENALYNNSKRMVLEFERNHRLRRYGIEGSQKMVMKDSVRYSISGSVE